jgi:hypothetical protein
LVAKGPRAGLSAWRMFQVDSNRVLDASIM